MPYNARVYRLLIASPGDVQEEREAIPDVIHAWNAKHSFDKSVVLLPVKWETHTRPEVGDRTQAIINRQIVEDADILVGVFWTRIGTHTGTDESGTVEEIRSFIEQGKPVLLYFSSAPIDPGRIDREQYARLMEFKESIAPRALYRDYASVDQLREFLDAHLHSTVLDIIASDDGPVIQRGLPPAPEPTALFANEFRQLLRRLKAEWIGERDSGPHNVNEGKRILDDGRMRLLELRSSEYAEERSGLASAFDEVIRELATIQRHRLYMDGGGSFREFWEIGNGIIERMEAIEHSLQSPGDGESAA